MNKKYLIFIFLVIIGIALFTYFHYASAEVMPSGWQEGIEGLDVAESAEGENWLTKSFQNSIFYILVNTGRGLLTLTQSLLDWVISDNFISIGFTDNAIVNAGLDVTKNLGNIIIILGAVIIALATILRVKEYQAQKTIPILILVALLINFAPMICGVIIDGSNITMDYFRNMGALSPNIQQKVGEALGEMMSSTLSGQQRFGQGIALVVFALFTSIIFLLYAILFAFRYVALWLLVIFSPLAFACYILKFTRKFFTQWWNQFLQWSIIGIPAMFVLFLTNKMLEVLNAGSLTSASPLGATGSDVVFQYLLPISFLIGGFFMTLQTGAAGANIVTGFFDKQVKAGSKKAGAFVADKTVVAGAKGAKKALREPMLKIGKWMKKERGEEGGGAGETADREALEKQKEEISGATYKSRKFGQWLGHVVRGVPGVRAVGRSISSGTDEANRNEINDKQKENVGKSISYQGKTINSVQALTRIAGLLAAIKDKNVKRLKDQGLITNEQIKKIMEDAIKLYPTAMRDMKKSINPELVEEAVNGLGAIPKLNLKEAGIDFNQEDKDKYGTLKNKLYATAAPKSIEEWDDNTIVKYAGSDVAPNISPQQFSAAARRGGPMFLNEYNKQTIKKLRKEGTITDTMTSEEKVNTIDEYFKKNNKALHTYRNNSAARSLGADIESIDIDKIDTDKLKKEVEKETEKEMEEDMIKNLTEDSEKRTKKHYNDKNIASTDINPKGEEGEVKKDPTKTDF